MAYKNYYSDSSSSDESKDMVWDLRQIYANKILGITLEAIKIVRSKSDFPAWFNLLKRDLFVETNHKMDKKEREEIKLKIEEIKQIISKHEQVYLGKQRDAKGYQDIDDALCDLEKMFWNVMEEHNMLGKAEGDEGLF